MDGELTRLLDTARTGDRDAMDAVFSTAYTELHRLARRQLAGAQGHSVDATALVHEAYFRLFGCTAEFEDRARFFAYAAATMRSVLVDHVRQRLAQKRGGDLQRVTQLTGIGGVVSLDEDLLSLDAALTRLAAIDPRLVQVVELRYFAGLTEPQVAAVLDRSERSVRRDWQKARMFLLASLGETEPPQQAA